MNFSRSTVGQYSRSNFTQLIIRGSVESLRIGSLGDFCILTKYLVLFQNRGPENMELFSSERVRHFCFSNDSGDLMIGGIKVPTLDSRVHVPLLTFTGWMEWLLDRVLVELGSKTVNHGTEGCSLEENRHSFPHIVAAALQDLHHQDPDRLSMLETLVRICLAGGDDPREMAFIVGTDGLEFLFPSIDAVLEGIQE